MKKLLMLAGIILICSSCSTKKINDQEDTFFNFVILNKNNREKRVEKVTWENLEGDSFPGLRLKKWLEADEID